MMTYRVSISDRQYGLLRYLYSLGRPASLDEISAINQLTLGSFKRRGWIAETPDKHSVRMTKEGKEALSQFEHGEFFRSVANMRFSSFLSLETYDEPEEKPAKPAKQPRRKAPKSQLRVVHRRASVA